MDWAAVGEILALVVVLLVLLPVIGLYARRRWLSRHSGMFDCAVRVPDRGGWVLGVARYHRDALQWFRVFSLSWRPRRTFRQGEWQAAGTRRVEAAEAVLLYDGQQVVTLRSRDGGELELALDPGSATGLQAWLEAAGPGRARYGNTAL